MNNVFQESSSKESFVFHRDVFWPSHFPNTMHLELNEYVLSRHAAQRVREKRLNLQSGKFKVVEYDYEQDKYTYRNEDGLVLVIQGGTIITAWYNHPKDTHSTLDKSKYVPSPSKKVEAA